MEISELTDLIIGEETYQIADHSVLNARDTYKIPDSNSSQNIKKELEEIWASNRSYGIFPLVENNGGLHEMMPDPECSTFVEEKDLKKIAEDITVRAKKALLKGMKPALVLAEIRKRIPGNPEYRKYFLKAAAEIKEAMGLIGNVYIDPSLFGSCPEGVKFMAKASVSPSFVLELEDCQGCVYHKKGSDGRHCILFDKRIEARVPWTDKRAMRDLFSKAMAEKGLETTDILGQVPALAKLGAKEALRRVYLAENTEDLSPRLSVDKAHVSEIVGKKTIPFGTLESKAKAALQSGVKVQALAKKLLERTTSLPETSRIIRTALEQIGVIKQLQLPCPICQVAKTSSEGKRIASYLPSKLSVSLEGACPHCQRDFSSNINYWDRPFIAPGMRSDFTATEFKESEEVNDEIYKEAEMFHNLAHGEE